MKQMESHSIGRFNVKLAFFPSSKNSPVGGSFFVEIDELILKFIWKFTGVVKQFLKEE